MKKTNKLNNSKYAVAYCRYSSEAQREESIEAQKIAIEKYAKEKGIDIIEWYIDRALSGTSADRKDFQRMIADSAKGNFGLVLVHKLDRFSRDLYDSAIYKQKLKQNGVNLFSVIERLDDSPESIMMESTLMGMAAYYSKNLAREALKGMLVNASRAICNGSKPGYGFKRVPRLDEHGLPMTNKKGMPLHQTVIDPQQAEAVKIIYNMTLDGYKRCEIIDRLHELGYRNAKGEEFLGTNLDWILRNERYTGTYIFHHNKSSWDYDPDVNVVRIEGGLPQIITKETFAAVQQVLQKRMLSRTPSHAEEEYLLTGKIFCGECGTAYSGARQIKGGKSYPYYKCNFQANYRNGRRVVDYCHNNTVQRANMEKYVLRQVSKVIFNEKLIEQALNEYEEYTAEVRNNSALIEMLQKQVKDIEKQITNIVNVVAATGSFSEVWQNKLNSLEADKRKAIEAIAQETKGTGVLPATKEELLRIYKDAQEIMTNGTFEEKKRVLHMFLNKVLVFKKNVEIYTNLIPIQLLGGIDISIMPSDFFVKTSDNGQNEAKNTEKDKEKGGIDPSSSSARLYSEKRFGLSGET